MISLLYKKIIKPSLFKSDPEEAHMKALGMAKHIARNSWVKKIVEKIFQYKHAALQQDIFGIHFENPVGLSAGFDKDGDFPEVLGALGFGFGQIGTVTLHPYEGNPKPRAVRYPDLKSLRINYGLKNIGVDQILDKVRSMKKISVPISFSVGKTNSLDSADLSTGLADYVGGTEKVVNSGLGDMITINISCPNTFGGEPFTDPIKLDMLLEELDKLNIQKPLLLKMPISLPWQDYCELCEVAATHQVDGLIIGNLSKDKAILEGIEDAPEQLPGGLSGSPTKHLSNALIKKTYKTYGDRFVIIGVGGIFSAEDAYEKIRLGASLVQLITGIIFEGPSLIKNINKGLVRLLKKDGFSNISEATGVAAD
jgi:dihydroorotate dehydrogenase